MKRCCRIKNQVKLWIYIFLVPLSLAIILLSHNLFAMEKKAANYPADFTKRAYIKADTVLQKQKKQQSLTLVDVRSKKAFNRFHIPGAINIPLHFIKTKAFLKNRPLILIHANISSGLLERALRVLHQKGFNAKILFGGLNAWMQQGGKIKGDLIAAQSATYISASIFHQDRWDDHHMIINISTSKKIRGLNNETNTHHLPLTQKRLTWLKRFESTIKSHKNKTLSDIWIIGDDTKAYEIVKRLLKNKIDIPLFFLKGGLPSYMTYRQDLTLSIKPRKDRLKTNSSCPNCETVE